MLSDCSILDIPRGRFVARLDILTVPGEKMTSLFIAQCSEPLCFLFRLLKHQWDIRAINPIVLSRSPPLTFSEIVYGKII